MAYLGRSNLMTRDVRNRELSLSGVRKTPYRDEKRGNKRGRQTSSKNETGSTLPQRFREASVPPGESEREASRRWGGEQPQETKFCQPLQWAWTSRAQRKEPGLANTLSFCFYFILLYFFNVIVVQVQSSAFFLICI